MECLSELAANLLKIVFSRLVLLNDMSASECSEPSTLDWPELCTGITRLLNRVNDHRLAVVESRHLAEGE